MSTTRIKISNKATVYHRVGASGDLPAHDFGTSDSAVSSLGGSGDFEIANDTTIDYDTSGSGVYDNTATGTALVGSAGTIYDFIYFKHTGYQDAAKTVPSTDNLKIGVGDPDVIGFQLAPGESIILHGFGTSNDEKANWKIEAAANAIYAEVVTKLSSD